MVNRKRTSRLLRKGGGRSRLVRTRVRAYVQREEEFTPRRAEYPRPDDRALLVHALADDLDRRAGVTTRELSGYVGIDEGLYASGDRLADLMAYAADKQPDVPEGIGARLEARSIDCLGPLITRRFYRARIPLVAWDMGWTLGRLAAHTGRLAGSADGFSLSLVGCGVFNAEGRWKDSKFHPRYELTPQGVGQVGVFVSCGIPSEEFLKDA
jgi:hypothetical protein